MYCFFWRLQESTCVFVGIGVGGHRLGWRFGWGWGGGFIPKHRKGGFGLLCDLFIQSKTCGVASPLASTHCPTGGRLNETHQL